MSMYEYKYEFILEWEKTLPPKIRKMLNLVCEKDWKIMHRREFIFSNIWLLLWKDLLNSDRAQQYNNRLQAAYKPQSHKFYLSHSASTSQHHRHSFFFCCIVNRKDGHGYLGYTIEQYTVILQGSAWCIRHCIKYLPAKLSARWLCYNSRLWWLSMTDLGNTMIETIITY